MLRPQPRFPLPAISCSSIRRKLFKRLQCNKPGHSDSNPITLITSIQQHYQNSFGRKNLRKTFQQRPSFIYGSRQRHPEYIRVTHVCQITAPPQSDTSRYKIIQKPCASKIQTEPIANFLIFALMAML